MNHKADQLIKRVDALLAGQCGSKCLDDEHERRDVAAVVTTLILAAVITERDRHAARIKQLGYRLHRVAAIAAGIKG